MYRKIERQDAVHQYDADGNAITTWDDKLCAWIINPEYENDVIDWCADSNGITEFPIGCTRSAYLADFPDAENYPDISVTWYWDKSGFMREFHKEPSSEDELSCTRSWGYLDYTEQQAIDIVGHYCDFNMYAYRTVVQYNGKVIFDGLLKD